MCASSLHRIVAGTRGQVLNEAFGLKARLMRFRGGSHGWNEGIVDGQWETFDATVNVRLSESVEALVKGGPKEPEFRIAMSQEQGREYRDATR